MFIKGMLYPFKRVRLNKASEKGQLFKVLLEKDADFVPSKYVSFFEQMYTLYRERKPRWFSLEFHGTKEGVTPYVWASEGIPQEFIQSKVNTVHSIAEVEPSEDYMKRFDNFKGWHKVCAELALENHYLFNLVQTGGDRALAADMIASICSAMQDLDESAHMGVQFILRPVPRRKVSRIAKAHLDAYRKTGSRPKANNRAIDPYLSVPKALGKAIRHTAQGTAGMTAGKDAVDAKKLNTLAHKAESEAFFELTVRIFCAHKKSVRKPYESLERVISSFASIADKNRFRDSRKWDKKVFKKYRIDRTTRFMKSYAKRRIHTYPVENYVTPEELATFVHFPSKHIPNVVRLKSKKLPVPAGIKTYTSIEHAWKDGAVVFGVSRYRGRTKYLGFTDLSMLMQHAYVIGGTGAGKSYFLSFLAIQIATIFKAGFTFFDIKGNVVDNLMRHLPKSEWDRVVYIDLMDTARYMPLNMLKQPRLSVYTLANAIVNTFIKVFSKGSIKEHSATVLRKALIAVISTDPNGTLLEVYRMFTDEDYLDWVIAQMEKGTEYPDVLSYWRDGYKQWKPGKRKDEASAIINKLETITQNETPRYTLCQKENAINFRKLMDERKIILINFGQSEKNEDDVVKFFGTLISDAISKAAFSRADVLPVEKRVPHIFIVDEFEEFIHAEGDMKKFLAMVREYGLGLILAHQSIEQIPGDLMGIIKDNTFTQIALQIGSGSASKVAEMFHSDYAKVAKEDLLSLEKYTGYGMFRKLVTQAFTFESLNMSEIYKEQRTWEEVQKWKDEYKNKHYKHLDEIKDDINTRYSSIKVLLDEKDIAEDKAVPAGDTSGKIKKSAPRISAKEGKKILRVAKETTESPFPSPQVMKGGYTNGAPSFATESENHEV